MNIRANLKKIVCHLLIILSLGLIIYDIAKEKKVETTTKQLHILATTSIIADVLKNLVQGVNNTQGQPHIIIHTLMKIGVNPHAYEATIQDAKHCNKAHVIIVSGLNLEGTMGHIFANLKKLKPIYTATDALRPEQIRKDTHFSSGVDPHFWGDPLLMHQVVSHLSTALQHIDPDHAQHYINNATIYQNKLTTLHHYIQSKIQQLPKNKRTIITSHDFLGYPSHRYNIHTRALQGFSTARETTLNRREELARTIINKGVNTIFAEIGINNRGIKSLVETCHLKGHPLHISHAPLYGDSIGKLDTPAGSYIGMMKHNIDTIVNALL